MESRAVLSDLGNVVVFFDNAKAAREMGRLLDRTPEEVDRALFRRTGFRRRYQRGDLATPEFLRLVCARLNVSKSEMPDEAALGEAFADVFTPNEPVMERLALLRKEGAVIAAVTNAEALRLRKLERMGALACFDHVVAACEERLLKPDPEMFVRALDRSGVPAERSVFIDDDAANLAPASALGIRTHLYRDVPGLDAFLESCGA